MKTLGLLLLQLLVLRTWGQCPLVAPCQPGNAPLANLSFGMGIYRVQLANLDTTTNGATEGYRDYSCGHGTVLQRGSTYTLFVRTNANADENVRAWIDFDNNGQFTAAEQVMASTARQHQAAFTVPAAAVSGQALRLRIAADYVNAPVPTACSTPLYSQTEDYRVVVSTTAPAAPVVRFLARDTVSCGGAVVFQDQSRNTPTAWSWAFGDGATSTQQHPQHTYTQPGTYAVRLRACNATGCDSLTKPSYIFVRADAPRSAPCQPATTGYCCGFGLTRVRLGQMDHVSADGSAGYEDFSCPLRATLTADQPYSLQLTTGATAQDVRVYLDLNDNGQFDLPSELLYEGLAVRNPSVVVQVAAAAGLVYNRPLRLRFWVDAAGASPFGACISPSQGQVEDYALVVLPNLAPPTAHFTLAYQQTCLPVRIALANTTTGGASSYEWRFGDGSISTTAVPSPHTYAAAGLYEVQLIARNNNGADTVRQIVAVAACPSSYCAAGGLGGSVTSPASFTRVQLGTIDNGAARTYGTGYYDFTNRYTELQAGQTYTLRTESLPWQFSGLGPWAQVAAWIDYNQDGQLGPSEMIGPLTSFSPHLLTIRVPEGAKLGATRLRVLIQSQASPVFVDICPPASVNASTEDYSLVIVPAPVAPTVGFRADLTTSCTGLVQFRDTSWAGPMHWQWAFGDGSTSVLQHPTHQYAAPGTYAVSLQVSNRYGTRQVSRPGYITVTGVTAGPHPAACLPVAGNTIYWGIGQLRIGASFAYSQPAGAIGYLDHTCTLPPLQLVRGVPQAVSFTAARLAGNNPNYYYNVYMWLDSNDDGVFNPASELVYTSGPFGMTQTGSLLLPSTVPLGQPLRLRVHYVTRSNIFPDLVVPDPCQRNEIGGQVRDFTVVATASPTVTKNAQSTALSQIFPNPSHGDITVVGDFTAPIVIEIYDTLGRRVYETLTTPNATGSLQVNLSHLPLGIYLIRLNHSSTTSHLVRY